MKWTIGLLVAAVVGILILNSPHEVVRIMGAIVIATAVTTLLAIKTSRNIQCPIRKQPKPDDA